MPGAEWALNCWLAAARVQNVPVRLLYAMGQVESSLRPDAVAHASNGTYSVGILQINSSWFPRLQALGITERSLYNPCVNIQVGAWILAQEIDRYGPTWEAIGAYYAGAYDARSRQWKLKHYRTYAAKVIATWKRLESHGEHAAR